MSNLSHPCLQIEYDGIDRLCEIHAVGISKTGRPCLRVYQVNGASLPADHFAYLALSKGFEPWGGGDERAPDDWDGGTALMRNGETTDRPVRFGREYGDNYHNDIIGYRKRVSIDWTQPIEAYNVDTGEVVPVKVRFNTTDAGGDYFLQDGVGPKQFQVFRPSGLCWANPDYPWRIRNRKPVKPALPTYDPETQVVVDKMTRREWFSRGSYKWACDAGIIRDEPMPTQAFAIKNNIPLEEVEALLKEYGK